MVLNRKIVSRTCLLVTSLKIWGKERHDHRQRSASLHVASRTHCPTCLLAGGPTSSSQKYCYYAVDENFWIECRNRQMQLLIKQPKNPLGLACIAWVQTTHSLSDTICMDTGAFCTTDIAMRHRWLTLGHWCASGNWKTVGSCESINSWYWGRVRTDSHSFSSLYDCRFKCERLIQE